ncbi:N-acetylmuramidase family protein [Rufibacter roseus]|uniref:N-acetylmuramidase family protein n=1 Tax=Rufibacter roseus TaxID=1567108 RepID=A0ABW2DM02_9BACT|nr:N-acetylmuramidase family protein [Rufibacter roseus]
MSKILTIDQCRKLAKEFDIELAVLLAVKEVEAGKRGFDPATGKIIIQFEPHWFKRYSRVWVPNGVESQEPEWKAFNKAFAINAEAAMLSTSIGLMQVMGFNYKAAGFKSVHEMWDRCKESEEEQMRAGLNFIKNNPALYKAAKEKDWHTFAYHYNGAGYKALAKRLKREPYNITLGNAYAKYARQYPEAVLA